MYIYSSAEFNNIFILSKKGENMNREEIFEMLKVMADGIAETFGSSCETVIHEKFENSHKIVYIRNGEVSGRKVGDTTSLRGDDSMINDFYKGKNIINYEAKTNTGKLIKSTTFHFKKDTYHLSLGINYDFTLFSLMDNTLRNFINTTSHYDKILSQKSDVNLNDLFSECINEIKLPIHMLTREDKKKIIEMLDNKSAFKIKNSIVQIAEKLNVSRYTIYNYLKEIRGDK